MVALQRPPGGTGLRQGHGALFRPPMMTRRPTQTPQRRSSHSCALPAAAPPSAGNNCWPGPTQTASPRTPVSPRHGRTDTALLTAPLSAHDGRGAIGKRGCASPGARCLRRVVVGPVAGQASGARGASIAKQNTAVELQTPRLLGGSCEEDRRERLWLGHGRAPAPRCNETAQPSPIHWGLRSGPRSLATAKQEETEEEGRDKVVREFDHLA